MPRPCAALVTAFLTAAVPLGARAQDAGDNQPPMVSFSPCETFQRDRPFAVTARFADQSALFEPKLVYHTTGDKVWKHVKFSRDGELWHASIPKAELTGALEYFVEVFDENGNGPSRVGSPESPLFARAVKRAPECPEPGIIAVPVLVEDHGTAAAQVSATTQPARGFMARCDDDAPPFYCKHWVLYAAGGAVLATIGIIVIASSGGDSRGYPERVTFVVQPRGLESQAR